MCCVSVHSFVSWQPHDAAAGSFHGVLIEWGFTREQTALSTMMKKKIKQINDRAYVKRVTDFHKRQPHRRIEVVTAIAVVGRVVLPQRCRSGFNTILYSCDR